MKLVKISLILIILGLIHIQCNTKPKVFLKEEVYNKIIQECPEAKGYELVIYYFNGDCVFCIAKAIELEKKTSTLKKRRIVFIANTLNPSVTLYNFKEKSLNNG